MVEGSAGMRAPIIKAVANTYGQGEAQTIVENLQQHQINAQLLRLICSGSDASLSLP
jgi:hypothetical protein